MAEETKRLPKLTFIYKRSADFKTIPANGVWGGITPRGDFKINFFVEYNIDPEKLIQELKPDGSLGKSIGQEESIDRILTREFTGAVLMTVGQAESVANWIMERIKEFRSPEEKT